METNKNNQVLDKNELMAEDNIELMNVKGTRDFLPEEKIFRDQIINTLKNIFRIYGYNPLETPALEMFELLSSKYTGGSEIVKEIYSLTDQAGRKLGLRYDLTVPFTRVMATNKNMQKPFKRFQIEKVWRDGPIKLGRYREFWQADVDIAGSSSLLADAELMGLSQAVFDALGLDVKIELNNRKLLNVLMKYVGIPEEKWMEVILIVDKLEKLGIDAVKDELVEKGLSDDIVVKLMDLVTLKGSNEEIIETIRSIIKESKEVLDEINQVIDYAKKFGAKDIVFSPSLARGLVFYTGTVFEVFLKSGKIKSSLAAGGRYDKAVGKFSGEEVPCVGISFGVDVIMDVSKLEGKIKTEKTETKLYVIPIKTLDEVISLVAELRLKGISTDFDLMSRSISKNLDFADKMGIPYVLIVGPQEIEKKKFKLKNMKSGEEEFLTLEQVFDKLA